MRRVFLILPAILVLVSCKPAPKTPKVVDAPKVIFPQINWKKAATGKVFVVGESRRRVFALEYDEKMNPFSIVAYEKNTGIKKWSREVDLGIGNIEEPDSFGVAVKSAAIGYWSKDNTIHAVDKYRGVEMWDKKVKGFGLSILGENFITAWNTKIRLVDPETGKTTDFEMGRKITSPIHVTPKGFIVVITGDTANLVDLENEKVNIRWSWEIDSEGGFDAGKFLSSDETLQVFQKTLPSQNLVYLKSWDMDKLTPVWKKKFIGVEGKPATFKRYGSSNARLVIIPEGTTERQWHQINLKDGKIGDTPVFSQDDPPKRCVLGENRSFCVNDKTVSFYETSTWKKLWDRETIYSVNDFKHMFMGTNLVLAAGTRVKSFRPDGSTAFVYELKARNMKDPRVNQILAYIDGILVITVVDYTVDKRTRKTSGEIWGFDPAAKSVKWKLPLDEAKSTLEAVSLTPDKKHVIASSKGTIYVVSIPDGKKTSKRLKLKNRSLSVKTGSSDKFLWAYNETALEVFSLEKLKSLGFFKLKILPAKSRIKIKKKNASAPVMELNYIFGAVDEKAVYLYEKNSKKLVAFEMKKGKEIWKLDFDSILDPRILAVKGKVFISSFKKSLVLNATDGKVVKELPGYHRVILIGDNVVSFRKINLKPKTASRLTAFTYEKGKKGLPATAWKIEFKGIKGKDPLDGFDSEIPAWVHSTTEYVFYPSNGGRCLKVHSAQDGSEILNLCKGAWMWPPLFYNGSFYAATGTMQTKIPFAQQGLVKFKLDGKWKRIIKMSKHGNSRYMNTQFAPLKKGTIYVQGSGDILHSISVSE
ncbi:MAG: PQQ-binding-like beta-propeller repeat protein [Deltaproteobacteria bacterium]|nr:PQQ-binding-like beta-propeller repeat protein [Deltaproteobacteria bacterium]